MNPGDSLDGRYTITERLGAGGMGEVYKATHTFLGSTRVIKIVRPQIAGNEDAQERFLREARAATKVHHPHVATLHDFAALPDGSHYMVWEFIDGENLAQRLRARGTLPVRQALRITIQALKGLEAIHRAGIVHRDISPENLMITHDDETVKIIDLGVAKVEDSNVAQTRTGIFVGKLRYASPEQLGFIGEDERIDGRTDLYALAMVLVELLTGRPPYEAKSPHEYFIIHAREQQTMTIDLPPGLPGGAALQSVLDKALARDRNHRYATARELAAALEEIDRTLPDQRDLPTMATPFDGDETMRVPPGATQADTLHRSTVRTDAPDAPAGRAAVPADVTVKTPMPMPMVAATPTVAEAAPLPSPTSRAAAAPAAAPVPQAMPRRSSTPAVIIILVVLVVCAAAVAGGVYFAWPTLSAMIGGDASEPVAVTATDTATTTATAPPASSAPPQTASSSLDVSEPVLVDEAPTLSATQPSEPPQASQPRAPVVTPRNDPRPPSIVDGAAAEEDLTADEEDTSHIDRSWRPGQRRDVSWRAELAGTRRVALRAGGSHLELVRALRQHFPNIRLEARAEVVVRYDARSGRGTVAKNGRVLYVTNAATPQDFADELRDIFDE